MAKNQNNNIDKAMQALQGALELEPEGVEISPPEKVVDFEPEVELTDLPDGGAEVNFDPNAPIDQSQIPFDANLADYIEEGDLNKLALDLIGNFESDKDTRKDWEDTYTKGLDMLGFKYENRTQPFEGSSGVVHPLLSESVTQFQAQAYKELLPPDGPVRTQIVGDATPEIEQQSNRVCEFMNYQITQVMKEYDPDMDQLLFYLPLSGSAFKKVYYDGLLKRAVSKFVSSEDLIINYYATDLESADRITHLIKITENELVKNQVTGFYRNIELKDGFVDKTDSADKVDELQGTEKGTSSDENMYTLLEMHANLDIPGFEDQSGVKLPYIVTIEQYSRSILSIRRNWNQQDPNFTKIPYFVHYKFLPGLGFYGFGLIHMLGGLSRTATSVLRQLIDAGTLANLPAGFKARGMRIRDHDEPLQPGEFRDVDVTGQSIKESLMMLPYKEPSAVLFQLLGFAVDAGKSFAAIADMKMGEGNEQNPVGTTMALLERGTKVMSAIHKRLHFAQKVEFGILSRLFQLYLPPEYPYFVVGGDRMIKQSDFDDRVDIIPVSDPNIFSMSQRVILAQTQLQMAGAAPQLHDMREAYRRVYQALNVDNIDSILKPSPDEPEPTSPAMENAMAMRGQQPKAFPMQDHQSHMKAHGDFMFTRMVQINPQLYAMMQSHVFEHVAIMAGEMIQQEFKQQIEQLKQMEQQAQQNPQMQQQFQQQSSQLNTQMAKRQSEIEAQITDQIAKEEEKRMGMKQDDPLVRLKQQEIDLRAMEVMTNQQRDSQKAQSDMMVEAEKLDLERDKLESQTSIDIMKASADIDKAKTSEANQMLKENIATAREAMKDNNATRREAMKSRSQERIARTNARSRSNGKTSD